MLLVIDIGNTNTVFGVFDVPPSSQSDVGGGGGVSAALKASRRWETRRGATADELAAHLLALLQLDGLKPSDITALCLCSVVPPATAACEAACDQLFHGAPLIVDADTPLGMPLLVDNPHEVGADRIVNGIAAYERVRHLGDCGVIVVDLGTATTFDCVSPRGEYLGGAIAPGLGISAEALFLRTSKLPRIELSFPGQLLGKNTVDAMRSGLMHGYAGLAQSLILGLKAELGFPVRVIATGGLAPLLAAHAASIDESDEHLTLLGLAIIHERLTATR